MIYVVDANNLAGKLGLLEEPEFDKLLFDIVSDYFSVKENEVFLVFDSNDPMGDKEKKENITIIFAPKDGYNYTCADDKILEIIKKNIEAPDFKEEITVVTDDNELKEKVRRSAEDQGCQERIHILSCSDFSERVNKAAERVNDDFFNPEDLDERDQAEITEELRELWN